MDYTVADLITIFRRRTEDPAYHLDANLPQSNSLWSNYELIQLIDQAQKEFAERTLIFKDSENFDTDVTASDPWIEYDQRIIRIENAELSSDNIPLNVVTIEDFKTSIYVDDYGVRKDASWESRTGSPRYLIRDIRQNYLRSYPIPTENDTLLLTVRRLPLNDITELTDELEVPPRYQLGLLKYVEKELFSKPIAVLAGFGDLISVASKAWDDFCNMADSRTKIRTRGPGQVRYGGL